MKKIVITGGSGFIGTNCVQFFLDRDYDVINLDCRKPLDINHNKYFINMDISNKNDLEKELLKFNPDFIIHLAGATGMESIEPEPYNFNYISAKNISDISFKLTNLKKIIFTSSLLVCRNGYIPKSDIDFCPPNGYGHSKALSEIVVRNSSLKVSWDIVRPTSIWGPWFSGGYNLFFKLASKGLFFNPKTDPIIKPTCYVGNAVYMIYKIMNSHDSGRVFYLADYPQTSVQDWANLIYKNKSSNKNLISISPNLLQLIAKFGDILNLIGINAPLSSSRLKNMLVSKEYPISNTKQVVGELPFTRKNSVAETIKWMNDKKK